MAGTTTTTTSLACKFPPLGLFCCDNHRVIQHRRLFSNLSELIGNTQVSSFTECFVVGRAPPYIKTCYRYKTCNGCGSLGRPC